MITFNIHAGITDNEIVHFMIKHNLLEKEVGYDDFEDDVEQLNSSNNDEDSISVSTQNYPNKPTSKNENEISENEKTGENIDKKDEKAKIVFFDEFNTCNSLGLLTEIMCDKRCQGVKVKKNVMFAGACNPYRKLRKKNQKMD